MYQPTTTVQSKNWKHAPFGNLPPKRINESNGFNSLTLTSKGVVLSISISPPVKNLTCCMYGVPFDYTQPSILSLFVCLN